MFSKARRLIRVYHAGLSRELNAATSYRGSLIIWMFSIVASSYISLTVWLAILGERSAIGAYDRSSLITYFLGVSLVSMLTGAWAGHFVAEDIRLGGLDRRLIKPWPYLHEFIINNMGEKVTKLFILLPMTLVLAFAFRADLRWVPSWRQLILFPTSVIMGAAIALLLNMCIGLLAFWVADITGVSTFFLAVDNLLSGRLFPLEFFPPGLRVWSLLSPFRFTVSLPVEILVGQQGMSGSLGLLAGQVAWLAALYALYQLMWRRGTRAYSSSGG